MVTGVIGISSPLLARYAAFYATLSGLQRPEGVVELHPMSAVISQNRNTITEEMLKLNADWVLYLDDDHFIPPQTLMQLLAADKDIISGHYLQREPPFNPVLFDVELPNGSFIRKQLNPQETGIVSVAAAGAGCLLVKRKVLEALEPPYWTLGQINPASWGDDLHFCSRVRRAGFEIHCDLTARLGHFMTGTVWPRHSAESGWSAAFGLDPTKKILVEWPMQIPGEQF